MDLLRDLKIKLYMNTAVGTYFLLKENLWDRHRNLNTDALPRGKGRNVVITGGNRGIGFEAVKVFLRLGYNVIVGCRNPDKCREEIMKVSNSDAFLFDCLPLDLKSLDSVRDFGKRILDKNIPIHLLVNNAGIMLGPRTLTKDGFESQFGVNHLSHFLLTSLLLPRLKEAGTAQKKARIVSVTSTGHFCGKFMDFDDLSGERFYSPEAFYGNSKLAQVLFTRYLSSKLSMRTDGYENVAVNCIHPGIVDTGLYEHVPYKFLIVPFMKTPAQGGHSILYAGLSPDFEGRTGEYTENSQVTMPSVKARDLDWQNRMWEKSMKMVGLDKFIDAYE